MLLLLLAGAQAAVAISDYQSSGLRLNFEEPVPLDFVEVCNQLAQDHALSLNAPINFLNPTPAIPKVITLDGEGFTISFPEAIGNYFNIGANVELILQNVVLHNFNPAVISYQKFDGKFGSINFGDGVIIKMRKDLKIAFNDSPWVFMGDAEIQGADFTLTLSGEDKLMAAGRDKNLTLNNLVLRPQGAYTFDNVGADSTITFKNSILHTGLDGCVVRNGNVAIAGLTKIIGIEKSYFDDGASLPNAVLARLGFMLTEAKCDNAPGSMSANWRQTLATGVDGTCWYIDPMGRVLRHCGAEESLVHDGTGKEFTHICVHGDAQRNYLALQTSASCGGRVLVSKDNGPLRDLGLPKVGNLAIGMNGSLWLNLPCQSGEMNDQTVWERSGAAGQEGTLFLDRTFTFSSAGNLIIKSGATLQICDGATLFYNGNPSGNELAASGKRHLVFEDLTATLHFLDGNLNAGNKGIMLESGNLIFEGMCSITTSFGYNKQVVLSSAVQAKILDGSRLEVYGKLDYAHSTRV
jgi:hypothetical protein